MGIDLFTLAAQVINLIILLFLLRKFLYIPVLKAVEARQKLIADELASAAQARASAQKEEAKCAAKLREIETQKQAVLDKVQKEAQQLAAKLGEEAQVQYKQSQQKLNEKLKAEHRNFDVSVQSLVVKYFEQFADNALKQIADADLNVLAVRQFMQKMMALSDSEKKSFAAAYSVQKVIVIKSAKVLPDEMKKNLENLLKQELKLKDSTIFEYTMAEELICGLSVASGEQMISWNLQSYLQEFRNNLNKEVVKILNRG